MTTELVLSPEAPETRTPSWFGASWVARVGAPADEPAGPNLSLRRRIGPAAEGARCLELHVATDSASPATAQRGACAVVFEGVLFDREELRRRLGLGRDDRATDAELVALAVGRWGEAAALQVKGLYAWVAWDAAREQLLAVRDRMGLFPLFHADSGHERLFSTSPALLAAHPRIGAIPNRAVMTERLCWRFFNGHETDFHRIFRLLPGHRLVVDRSGERDDRYWNPIPADGLTWHRGDVVAEVDRLLRQAVDRCLALGPPAIFLSGGLDSVNVAALATDACRAAERPVPFALSCVFPGQASEIVVQRGVAGRLGLEQYLIDWDEASGGDQALARVTALSPEFPLPLQSQWKHAYLRLAEQAVAHERAVILTGNGGDEWMDMGMRWAGDLLQQGELREFWRLWKTLDRCYPRGGRHLAPYFFWRYGARPVMVSAAMRGLGPLARSWVAARKRKYTRRTTLGWLAPDESLRRELDERALSCLPDPPLKDFLVEMTRVALDSCLDSTQKEELYETGRRSGTPIVSPLLDPDLVDFMMCVPQEVLHRGGVTKALLREPAVRRFPGLGFEGQRKLGTTALTRSFVRDQAAETMATLGGLRRLGELGIVAPAGFEAWLQAALAATTPLDSVRIWYTLSLESWARHRVELSSRSGTRRRRDDERPRRKDALAGALAR